IAASILSFGMLTARAFWITRRSVGFEAGSEPPDFTDMVMSLAMRANCFAMRFQRANMVCLRTSKMRPMGKPRATPNLSYRHMDVAAAAGGERRANVAPKPPRWVGRGATHASHGWPGTDTPGLRGAGIAQRNARIRRP